MNKPAPTRTSGATGRGPLRAAERLREPVSFTITRKARKRAGSAKQAKVKQAR